MDAGYVVRAGTKFVRELWKWCMDGRYLTLSPLVLKGVEFELVLLDSEQSRKSMSYV